MCDFTKSDYRNPVRNTTASASSVALDAAPLWRTKFLTRRRDAFALESAPTTPLSSSFAAATAQADPGIEGSINGGRNRRRNMRRSNSRHLWPLTRRSSRSPSARQRWIVRGSACGRDNADTRCHRRNRTGRASRTSARNRRIDIRISASIPRLVQRIRPTPRTSPWDGESRSSRRALFAASDR